MPREMTTKLLEMVDSGAVDARKMLRDALGYMSEADVKDFASSNGYEDEDETDEDETDEDETDEDETDEDETDEA